MPEVEMKLSERDKLIYYPPEIGCVLSLSGLPGGGNKIYDRSPYGNIGTITGATWARTPGGLWYLDFNGTNSVVNLGSPASLDFDAGDFTLKVWFRSTVTNDNWDRIISHYGATGESYIVALYLNGSNKVAFIVRDVANKTGTVTGTSNVENSAWHILHARRLGTAISLFVDGISEGTPATIAGLGDVVGTRPWIIGANWNAAGTAYESFVDADIAFPNFDSRALSALEIQRHYEREKSLFL